MGTPNKYGDSPTETVTAADLRRGDVIIDGLRQLKVKKIITNRKQSGLRDPQGRLLVLVKSVYRRQSVPLSLYRHRPLDRDAAVQRVIEP